MKFLINLKSFLNRVLLTSVLMSSVAMVAISPTVNAESDKPVQEQTIEKVSINKADVEELAEVLVGVGLKKAEAIVTYRTEIGKFESVEQLIEVKGIGEKTLEKNKDKIIL